MRERELNKMPIQINIKLVQDNANSQIIDSIARTNLCSLKKVSSSILVNPVLQIQGLEGNICLNYLNLTKSSAAEFDLALQTAVHEEYTGIYGILLERQWPFQRIESDSLLQREATERLINSLVFILKPPPKKIGRVSIFCKNGEVEASLAAYEVNNGIPTDGFSQSRDKSVISGKTLPHSVRITEIKTTHVFSKSEMQAILVPEHLVSLVEKKFTGVTIIAVPTQDITLRSIPHILSILHDQKITKPINVKAPDYLLSLSTYIKENKLEECSIHAVRLHTSFDFTMRTIQGIASATSQNVISKSNATVIPDQRGDDDWIIVHKSYGISKEPVQERLKNQSFPEKYLERMKTASKHHSNIYDQLVKSKGNRGLSIIYDKLSLPQIEQLERLNVQVVSQDNFMMISFDPAVKNKVKTICNNKLFMQQAAIIIQSTWRGFWSRKIVTDYKENKSKLVLAEQALEEATLQLEQSKNKLSSLMK